MKEKKLFYGQKISTDIEGLDELLFGGLYLNSPDLYKKIQRPLSIAVYGDRGTSKSLFAMQLQHGITKSLHKLAFRYDKNVSDVELKILDPIFYSDNKSIENLSDMFLDFIISKTTRSIVENTACKERTSMGNIFCNMVFETDGLINYPINKSLLDKYVGEEILVYNTHTNALHLAQPTNQYNREQKNDIPVFRRKDKSVKEFAEAATLLNEYRESLLSDFINVIFWEDGNCKSDMEKFVTDSLDNSIIPCMVIDIDKSNNGIQDFYVNSINIKQKCLVMIYVFEDIPDNRSSYDMMIEMRRQENDKTKYIFNQLSIKKSTMQDTAIGWHIFKKRDYGIEVYPSTHVILQKRRHMPKGLLLSQRNIFSSTYQRQLDENTDKNKEQIIPNIENGIGNDFLEKERLSGLYKKFNDSKFKNCPADILRKILLPAKNNTPNGDATAIIGMPNTFKRLLTLSSTFNACCQDKHTLNILLDKEDSLMSRKMICPAYIKKNKVNISDIESYCHECYKKVHFSNIRMGCISSDEFFYYLIKQIKISRKSDHVITRIVIDDLQKIEFCFPMLNNDNLFLTTLISICKDYDIDLFMLCDKSSSLVRALRAQADNVICTERIDERAVSIYIERYVGYCIPSQLWKCNINDIFDTFYCDLESESDKKFNMSERHIVNEPLITMESYWIKNDYAEKKYTD